MRSTLRPPARALLLFLALALTPGCAARWAYRQGLGEAKKGNWDLAVARLTKALQKDTDNIGYKIALENARSQASRQHQLEGRKHLTADDLEKAEEELGIAVNYDPANRGAVDELAVVRDKIKKRDEEKERLAELEVGKLRAKGAQYPVPVLSPRNPAAIAMSFPDQSLEKVFIALGKVAGVNVLFDEGFRDKPKVTVNLMGVSFEEALEQLTFSNRLFYKVLDRNTIIIAPEGQPKRRQYDDIFLRTFYLRNADTKDVEPVIKGIMGAQGKVVSNQTLGAITVTGTIDQLALAERMIDANDKARGEVVVELQIMEVNRKRLKDYGIKLANHGVAVTLSPTGGENEVVDGALSVRAHLLSSLNLSDFIVSMPATVAAKLLQTDGTARILAAPKLRAAEGKKTTLKIGQEVPVPVTTFQTTVANPNQSGYTPATSFNYKNVGVNLQITPRIAAGGEITLEMSAEFSSTGADSEIAGQKLPSFLTRNVDGVLRLRDGETTLLGGLMQRDEKHSISGVFGLQDVPLLGPLVSSHEKKVDDTEILISITPRLVRAPHITEADLKPLYIGTQDLPKVPSARPPLFGAPEEPLASPSPVPSASPKPQAPVAPAAAPSPAAGVPPPLPARPALAAALTPLEAKVKPGEATAVSVVLMNAQDLTGVEVVIAFDSALVEALDLAAGSLMTLGGVPVNAERAMEPGRARVRLTRASGVAGSGVVAALTLKGLREGGTTVTVETLTVTTATGREQVRVAAPVHITVLP
ncbi:MAG TPA: secretin N-terminal domain-containing protein [Vicinamibacteria bacterium]|nr:secretin N-terminal domain-containing protein [Vicinamibacteria bacterium]